MRRPQATANNAVFRAFRRNGHAPGKPKRRGPHTHEDNAGGGNARKEGTTSPPASGGS